MSKTPGRTRLINFFEVQESSYLVDLPGYGYAQVPGDMKRHWARLLTGYLNQRRQINGLVVVMDARHPMTPLDQQLLNWFAATGKPVHVLLTKADKLSRSKAAAQLQKVRSALRKEFRLAGLLGADSACCLRNSSFQSFLFFGVDCVCCLRNSSFHSFLFFGVDLPPPPIPSRANIPDDLLGRPTDP